MGYPDAPNWQSGQPLAGWFQVTLDNTGDRASVCATQGRGFIKYLQRKLNSLGGLIGPALTVDGIWGTNTQRALVNVANRVANSASDRTDEGHYRTMENTLGADDRSRNISRATMQFAAWVAYYLRDYDGHATYRLDKVFIPLSSTLPRFGSAPDDDRGLRNGETVCWDRDRDPAPTPATREQVDQARATGSTGIAPGTSSTGVTPSSTSSSRGMTTGAKVIVGAVLVGGVVYLITRKRRGGRRRRR